MKKVISSTSVGKPGSETVATSWWLPTLMSVGAMIRPSWKAYAFSSSRNSGFRNGLTVVRSSTAARVEREAEHHRVQEGFGFWENPHFPSMWPQLRRPGAASQTQPCPHSSVRPDSTGPSVELFDVERKYSFVVVLSRLL